MPNKLTKEIFVQRAISVHGYNRYDYSQFIYKGALDKGIINCLICNNSFEQTPNNHVNLKRGCPFCADTTSNNQEFTDKAIKVHGNRYDYSKFIYKNSKTKGIINCLTCKKDFKQTPNDHISRGAGCPFCTHIISKGETEWLNSLNILQEYRQKTIKINNRIFKVDAVINNIIYEFNGDYWHGNPKKYKAEDINPQAKKTFGELYRKTLEKEKILKEAGYEVISIWESEWNKINTIK
jgi:hypothetical protein